MNYKLFRGYATTAAVREGHTEILEILLKAGGAAQAACEEALLEACQLGQATHANILMASQMIRPHVALHALVTASSRGFIHFVDSLLKVPNQLIFTPIPFFTQFTISNICNNQLIELVPK